MERIKGRLQPIPEGEREDGVFIYIVAAILLAVSCFFTCKLVDQVDLVKLSVDDFDNLDPRDKKIEALVHQNFIKKATIKQIVAAVIAASTSVLCCFLTQPSDKPVSVFFFALGAIIVVAAGSVFTGSMIYNLLVALPGSRRFTANETKKT